MYAENANMSARRDAGGRTEQAGSFFGGDWATSDASEENHPPYPTNARQEVINSSRGAQFAGDTLPRSAGSLRSGITAGPSRRAMGAWTGLTRPLHEAGQGYAPGNAPLIQCPENNAAFCP